MVVEWWRCCQHHFCKGEKSLCINTISVRGRNYGSHLPVHYVLIATATVEHYVLINLILKKSGSQKFKMCDFDFFFIFTIFHIPKRLKISSSSFHTLHHHHGRHVRRHSTSKHEETFNNHWDER